MDTVKIAFAAIDRKIEQNIPLPKESEDRGKNFIYWGDANDYPVFLHRLYLDCPILQTIINTTTDYVVGNGVSCSKMKYANRKNQTWDDLFLHLAADYLTFGIAYLQVIRNNAGQIAEFYNLDSRYVRSDYKNEMFFYNEDYVKKYSRSNKTLIYPKFVEGADAPASVICIKTPHSRGVYGTPVWGSAVKSVVTEIEIDNFHLSELENNFAGSAIINMPNGIPSDDEIDEIEKRIEEKFVGSENAGRFLLNFCNGKDNAATIERLATDDFDKRYDSLEKKTKQQIFTAFAANPNLFGCASEGSTGFNQEEYDSAFKLYNRTRVRPIQTRFCDAIDKAFGEMGTIVIKPFSISEENNEEKEVQ